jgi:hypothetical protein
VPAASPHGRRGRAYDGWSGDCVAEIALRRDMPRTPSVTAIAKSRLVVLGAEGFGYQPG